MMSTDYQTAIRDFVRPFPEVVPHFWHGPDPWMLSLPQPWIESLFQRTFIWEIESRGVKTPKTIQITPARLLLEAGIALTAAAPARDLRAGYAMVRYG